ncbi:type II secretion system F family protein [Nonomuraea sp. NPDC050783]|uniref:type II secretion system F family protein n=1 Tax=Nonomuraea sp. NPDC050783 TaxID=3154634 RepID=UPI0034663E9B
MLHLLSALCAATATWLWLPPRTPHERLADLCPPRDPAPEREELPGPPARSAIAPRTVIAAASAGLAIALLIGGTTGTLAGLLTAPATGIYLHRKQPTRTQHDRRQILLDLPFAADLLTACLLAGRPISSATEITAEAVGGPLGERLTWVSSRLRLGADPEPTWALLAREPELGQLSRTMVRAMQSGTPVADALTRLADDAREAARASAAAAARRVGVKAVAPLGLCFLPAFVLLGIVPVVAGLASAIVLP